MNEKLIQRLAVWITQIDALDFELRCRTEVIDGFTATEPITDESALALASDIDDAATSDCEDEGKKRTYTLVAIKPNREQWVCPISIRKRPAGKTTEAILESLAKANTELHNTLMRERKEGFAMLLTYAETVSANHARLVKENERNSERAEEVITRLEKLRTQELERQMLREKHDKDIEVKDRITDALLPLGMAIGKRLTGSPMLPNVDLNAASLVQIAKGMQENQLPIIQDILGPLWPEFDTFWMHAVEGRADVQQFKKLVNAMTHEQLMAVAAVLNTGQQAALKEVLASL